MTEELRTDDQVEAVEQKRPEIKAGSLRERVKSGELNAEDVLAWLKEQEGPISDGFVSWLRRFEPRRAREKQQKEAEEEKKQEEKAKIKEKERPRKKKHYTKRERKTREHKEN